MLPRCAAGGSTKPPHARCSGAMERVWCPWDVATFGVLVAGCVATEGRSASLSVAGCVVARDVNAVKEDAWEAVRQD